MAAACTDRSPRRCSRAVQQASAAGEGRPTPHLKQRTERQQLRRQRKKHASSRASDPPGYPSGDPQGIDAARRHHAPPPRHRRSAAVDLRCRTSSPVTSFRIARSRMTISDRGEISRRCVPLNDTELRGPHDRGGDTPRPYPTVLARRSCMSGRAPPFAAVLKGAAEPIRAGQALVPHHRAAGMRHVARCHLGVFAGPSD
jgi:hypothetical protein